MEKMEKKWKKWKMENNGENSGPLSLLPVDRLTATDCNADRSCQNNGENSGPLTSLPVDRLTATDCNADRSCQNDPFIDKYVIHKKVFKLPKYKMVIFITRTISHIFPAFYAGSIVNQSTKSFHACFVRGVA